MSIKEILEKIKPFYILLLILVISSIFFGVGRLSSLEENHTPIKIEYLSATSTSSVINAFNSITSPVKINNPSFVSATTVQTDGPVIGSKSGKKYYFPWCGTVKRIKPENQVYFTSSLEARAMGFLPGGNCKGLK